MFARDIDFAFFYDLSSTSSNCYAGAVPFCCSFYYLSILHVEHHKPTKPSTNISNFRHLSSSVLVSLHDSIFNKPIIVTNFVSTYNNMAKVNLFQAYVTIAKFLLCCLGLLVSCSQRHLIYFSFQTFDFERTLN
jgi:hypothetical protein